jgi:hypothetical protein
LSGKLPSLGIRTVLREPDLELFSLSLCIHALLRKPRLSRRRIRLGQVGRPGSVRWIIVLSLGLGRGQS